MSSVEEEPQGLLSIVDAIGNFFSEAFSTWWDIIGMISIALAASKDILQPSQRPIFWGLFKDQLYESGVRAVYINGVIAVFIGGLLMARLFSYFPKQVLSTQYAYLFVVVVVRELGPLISGIILIARSATAVTSKIGNLRIRREFQVLHALGINPVFLFLVPVFFAFPISLFLMLIYFDFICILSAYAVIWISDPGVSFILFLSSILEQISLNEVGINAVKAILGGMLIGVISIHFGAKATESFEDVSEAISNSTTTQLMAFFLLNVVLSLLAYTQ